MNTDSVNEFKYIEQINTSKLTDADRRIFTVDIGDIPKHKVHEFSKKIFLKSLTSWSSVGIMSL